MSIESRRRGVKTAIADRKCLLDLRSLLYARGYVIGLIMSIDRARDREMWIGPTRNLLIIEKVRIGADVVSLAL